MCLICTGNYDPQTITSIDCAGCPNLTTIPPMPLLEALCCSECPKLTTLTAMPSLTYLDCSDCPSLITLCEMPVLGYLDCGYCPSLERLPQLPSLSQLKCYHCTKLKSLPEMPMLRMLGFGECFRLVKIPVFPSLQMLGIILRSALMPEVACSWCMFREQPIGSMIVRMKKTLRQRWVRLTAERYLKSPGYRQLAIEFYQGKQDRDKTRLEKWLERKQLG